jgi:hypothetical protein
MDTKEKRIKRLQESPRGPEWLIATRFFERELERVLSYILDKNVDPFIKISLKKYLIIACVSLIDDFLRHLIRRVIDQYGIGISSLSMIKTPTEIEAIKKVSEYAKKTNKKITKGEYVSAFSNCTNKDTIDQLFSELLYIDKNFRKLNMGFFEAIKKVDSLMSLFRFVKGPRSLSRTWHDFINIFELRTAVVHEMKEIDISDRRLKEYCNNTMTFLSAAIFVVDPMQRDDVIHLLK